MVLKNLALFRAKLVPFQKPPHPTKNSFKKALSFKHTPGLKTLLAALQMKSFPSNEKKNKVKYLSEAKMFQIESIVTPGFNYE